MDAMNDERKKGNARLGLILASIAAAFFIGIFVKMWFLGR